MWEVWAGRKGERGRGKSEGESEGGSHARGEEVVLAGCGKEQNRRRRREGVDTRGSMLPSS